MRNRIVMGLAVAAAIGAASTAMAAPYASGISQTGTTVSFILNESADNVTVELDGGGMLDLGALGKGTHSFDTGGSATWSIKASKAAAAGWTQISNDGDVTSKYYSPKGVDVNRNIVSSNFGRIYVGEGLGGAVGAGGRTTTDGLYIMGADQSDITGQGDTGWAGGVDWSTSSYSPFKIAIAPDDSVYIADWSDPHAGVWRSNANGSGTFDEILTNAGRDGTGLVAGVHGSVASVYVEGTGANTVLYTLDEDFDAGGGMGSILRYNIGTQTGYAGTPSEQVQDLSNYIQNSNMDLVRDEDGSWWVCQYRWTDGDAAPTLSHWEDGATAPSWTSGTSTIPLDRGYGILAIDNSKDLIAVGTVEGMIYILDISDPSNPALVDTIAHAGNTIRDVAWDLAGNLYVVSSSSETLRIYSPGGDMERITTSDGMFFDGLNWVPEPGTLAFLAIGGLALLRRRRA